MKLVLIDRKKWPSLLKKEYKRLIIIRMERMIRNMLFASYLLLLFMFSCATERKLTEGTTVIKLKYNMPLYPDIVTRANRSGGEGNSIVLNSEDHTFFEYNTTYIAGRNCAGVWRFSNDTLFLYTQIYQDGYRLFRYSPWRNNDLLPSIRYYVLHRNCFIDVTDYKQFEREHVKMENADSSLSYSDSLGIENMFNLFWKNLMPFKYYITEHY